MRRVLLALATAATLTAVVPWSAHAQGTDGVSEVVLELDRDGRPQLRVRAPAGADLRHFELTGPPRLVLDVRSSRLTASAPVVPDAIRDRFQRVRVARFNTEVVRVVVDLASAEPYAVAEQGPWWVITFTRPTPGTPRTNTTPPPAPPPTVTVPPTSPAAEPTPRPDGALEVQVVRVTGSTFYVNAGTRLGLGKGQTIQVERTVGRGRGTLEVLSATSNTAVLSFSGRAFPLTRGDGLRLTLPQARGPDRALGESASVEPAPDTEPTSVVAHRTSLGGVWALPPNVTGRISMELDARASRSDWDPVGLDATRTFVTPLTRLQFSARDLAGGVSVNGRIRAAYRYGSDGVIDPAASVRVYEFDAERRFDALPLRLKVGRFFSPYEAFSGYWDGLLLRAGGDGFGVGGVVGLEPDRWNQNFSVDRPKVSGFLDFRASGADGGFEGDLAVTHVRPSDGRPTQLYLGSSGRAWIGGLGISHTVQVDQHPETLEWIVSDLLVQARVPVTRALQLRGRWSRRSPHYFWLNDPFSFRRDDVGGGATVRWRGGSLLADVALHQADGDTVWSRSATGALRLDEGLPGDLAARIGVSVWDAPFGRISTASLSLDRFVGRGWFNGAYRIYRSEGGWQDLTTHHLDASASWQLPDGVRLTGLASTTVGGGLLQQRVQVGVSRSF